MNPLSSMGAMGNFNGQDQGTNLLSIIINVLFGFVAGLMFFFGPMEVVAYGSKLAADLMKTLGLGSSFSQFGLVTTAAPYVILTPIFGVALSQLAGVNSLKKFLYFAIGIIVGFGIAYLTQGYFAGMI